MDENSVIIKNTNANKALEYKQELTKFGLNQDIDFIWIYHAPLSISAPYVEFIFNEPSVATYYRLKWL